MTKDVDTKELKATSTDTTVTLVDHLISQDPLALASAPDRKEQKITHTRTFEGLLTIDKNSPEMQDLWFTHRAFNEAVKTACIAFQRAKRGEVEGANPDQMKKMEAFMWGLFFQDAKFAPDIFNKAAQQSSSDKSARKPIEKHLERLKEIKGEIEDLQSRLARLDSTSTDGAVQTERAKVEKELARKQRYNPQIDQTIERCLNCLSAFDEFQKGWYPFSDLKRGIEKQVTGIFIGKVISEAVQIIKANQGSHDNWRQEHDKWKEQRAEWFSKNPEYKAVAEKLIQFEDGVDLKKGSYFKQLRAFFSQNPELAAWRGGQPVVHDLTEAERSHASNLSTKEAGKYIYSAYMEKNPELSALIEIHRGYKENFYRPRFIHRNNDGFEAPPTFTLPHHLLHPRFQVLKGPKNSAPGYRNLEFKPSQFSAFGQIDLRVLRPQEGGGVKPDWITVPLRAHAHLRGLKEYQGEGADYLIKNPKNGRTEEVSIKGIRVVFPDILHKGTDYPKRAELRIACEFTRTVADRSSEEFKTKIDSKTKQRYLAFAQPCKIAAVIPSVEGAVVSLGEANMDGELSSVNVKNVRYGADSLARIQEKKQRVALARELSGQTGVADYHFGHHLKDAVFDLQADRSKRVAARVVRGLVETGVSVVILEDRPRFLPNNVPTHYGSKSAFSQQSTGIREQISMLAERAGIKVVELSSFGIYNVDAESGMPIWYLERKDNGDFESSLDQAIEPASKKIIADPYRNAAINMLKVAVEPSATKGWTQITGLSKKEKEAVLTKLKSDAVTVLTESQKP